MQRGRGTVTVIEPPAAELLYPPVSRALNELENIWSDLAARRGVLEGTVRIGAFRSGPWPRRGMGRRSAAGYGKRPGAQA
ncbi:hypothetical protein FK514_26830, partial [Klebsiella pneumoniae]|nr:hypothetical protein [Klebsiella pneumoniae]